MKRLWQELIDGDLNSHRYVRAILSRVSQKHAIGISRATAANIVRMSPSNSLSRTASALGFGKSGR
jgi:hypothetical protein